MSSVKRTAARIRRRVANALLSDELRQLEIARDAFREMAHWQPLRAHYTLDAIGGGLSEGADQRYLDLVRRMLVGSEGFLFGERESEQERLLAVQESRQMFNNDPFSSGAINMWTDYGAGISLKITPHDEGAGAVWDEFWKAPRNRRYLNDLAEQDYSNTTLTDGEYYWVVFTSEMTGFSTLRTLLTDEVSEVITHPDDAGIILYYRRKIKEQVQGRKEEHKDIFYPDWQATDEELGSYELPSGAVRADEMRSGTDVKVIQVAHMRRGLKGKRGWPLGKTGFAWSRTYRNFVQDRAAVAKLVASAVDKVVMKTGSRGLDAVKRSLQSSLVTGTGSWDTNPPPEAGSVWMENEAATRERMPMNTGASDARWDGFTIGSQAALGLGNVPIMLLGRPDMAQNKAIAEVVMQPFYKQMQRYRMFRAGAWRDLVVLVLSQWEVYGQGGDELNLPTGEFGSKDVDTSSDSLVQATVADVVAATDALNKAGSVGASKEMLLAMSVQLMILTLRALGISDPEQVLGIEDGIPDDWLKPTEMPEQLSRKGGGEEEDGGEDEDEKAPAPEEMSWEGLEKLPLIESHKAEEKMVRCPLPDCDGQMAFAYPDHKGLLVCVSCSRTFDPEVEVAGVEGESNELDEKGKGPGRGWWGPEKGLMEKGKRVGH